ncbi:MAG: extracellular solute-binding protein [Rhodospirillales bacterium]|jgi:iron(III) transport system substrate-binding protein|nr:extracellular solute-binding protein [Rhodospirillales bacterium]
MNRLSKLGTASAAVLTAAMVFGGGTAALAQSGEVTYYGYKGAMIPATIKAFNKIYPNIKVKVITGQGTETLARIKAEKENPQGDVIYGDTNSLINNYQYFEPYKSKHHDAFPAWSLMMVGDKIMAYGYNVSIQIFVVNTNVMKIGDAPTSWKQLMEPKYKGKFMVGNPALSSAGYYSFSQMYIMNGREGAEKYVENGTFMPKTNLVPANVGRGETAFGLVEETKSWGLADKGFPVKVIYPDEGVVPTVAGIGLIKNRPNMENGRLFAEFMNSREGHNINVATRNRRAPRKDADAPRGLAPFSELKLNPKVNVDETVKNRDAWVKIFDEFFYKKQKKGS